MRGIRGNRRRAPVQTAQRAESKQIDDRQIQPDHGVRRRTKQDAGRDGPARDAQLPDRPRCPRRQMKQRAQGRPADPGPPSLGLVDPLCLRDCGSALSRQVTLCPRQGEVCPASLFTTLSHTGSEPKVGSEGRSESARTK
jgi:hypothetical protein